MRILFLAQHKWPHVGGVEKHIKEISLSLRKKGHEVNIISEEDIRYPHIKFIGLLYIWYCLFAHRDLLTRSDLVHCHDVFIWYLPFRFLYPNKPVITTIHGLEWNNPLSPVSIWQKRLAAKLSSGTISVGKFLEKYLKVKSDLITYGAVSMIQIIDTERKTGIVYVGRLEENTGLLKFLEWLKKHRGYAVEFCGDGELRKECEKYGKVHGFVANPTPYLKKAKYAVPGGYLAALEALSAGCELKLFWNNKIKEDYWKMSPFVGKNVKAWAKSQTWEKLADEYINLYNGIK